MKLFSELQRAVKALQEYQGSWAICGGVAASIYRETPRFTADIDFALIDTKRVSAIDLASKVLSELGYREYLGFIPNTTPSQGQILGLVCARTEAEDRFVGIDFLLPVQGWVEEAVVSAQSNLLDYGFAHLPTITPEALILSKLTALAYSPERPHDFDDIKDIVRYISIDKEYLRDRIISLNLPLSLEIETLLKS